MDKAARKRRGAVAAGIFAMAFAVYALATWPVLREFGRAIPYTDCRVVSQTTVPLQAGDHLQLLYHFWLGRDALAGNSPFFTNVYEFNLGTDEGHRLGDLYYLPFSAVYMALAGWLGNAAGWNAAQAFAGVLGTVFLALWARRFTRGWGTAAVAAAVAGAVSYRWATLLCGSPTGLGMAFPPLLAWGLDRGVRGGERAGWGWAVVAMGCAYASDLHTFYFSGLAAPALAGMSLWASAAERGSWREAWGTAWRSWRGLWPMWAALGALGAWAVAGTSRDLSNSVMKTGRTIFEMANYSPRAEGVFGREAAGMARHVYLGWPLVALAGLCAALGPGMRRWRGEAPKARAGWGWAWVALCAGIVLLGLGIHAPPAGIWARAARKLVPGYSMIRQTAKAYSVLPTLLVPLLAAGLSAVFERGEKTGCGASTRAGRWVPGLAKAAAAMLAAAAVLDGATHTRAGLSVLPETGDEGRAIAEAARAAGEREPRALAIPLWPGDSHWSSVYEYAAMVSGVRWVNGYSPMTPDGYAEKVFKRFEPLNQGVADDARLDELLAMGVRYIEVFPHAFPEKVSPWPPALTVWRLAENPRLAPLWGDGGLQSSFAFRILPAEQRRDEVRVSAENWANDLWPASIHWKFADGPERVGPGETHSLNVRAPIEAAERRRVAFRVAVGSAWPGGRELRGERRADAEGEGGLSEWKSVPMESPMGEVLEAGEEGFTLEHAYVAAGEPWRPDESGTWNVVPALMWHGGLMRPGRPEVEFRPDRTWAGVALYGPQLPVPAGRYHAEIKFRTAESETADEPAAAGEPVGEVRVVSVRTRAVFAAAPIRMGETSAATDACELASEPIRIEVVYAANATLVVERLRLVPES